MCNVKTGTALIREEAGPTIGTTPLCGLGRLWRSADLHRTRASAARAEAYGLSVIDEADDFLALERRYNEERSSVA